MATVLVVEDNPNIRRFLVSALREEGYAVRPARDGAEALALLERDMPRVILLDMNMPVLDGRGFAAALRHRHDDKVPVICMTAAVDAGRSSSEIGAEATLAKPFELDDLLAVVHRYCQAD